MYSPLFNFLKSPNKEFDFDKDLDTTLIKYELNALILRFAKGPEQNSISLDLDNSISNAKNLFGAFEECKSTIKTINRVTDLDSQLSKEMDLFTSEGGRGEYLQTAYSYLRTSVDCECFSMAPYVLVVFYSIYLCSLTC